MVITKKISLAQAFPNLLNEWDYERNISINPNEISYGSGKKVFWICKKNHRYECTIHNRTKKNKPRGCPYCAGKKAIRGENDLFTLRPQLKKEWDFECNKDINPYEITIGSHKLVGWICNKGHKYNATIYNRTKEKNTGCPYCSGRLPILGETDLNTVNPKLSSEWDYEKNKLRPTDYTSGSTQKVWWKCKKGHSYEATIASRGSGSGCPYCSGRLPIKGSNDLLTMMPELAEEWDYEFNENLMPEDVSISSDKKVGWICKKGHKYVTAVKVRASLKCNCPYCAGLKAISGENDLATLHPNLLKEWDFEKNKYSPYEVLPKSSKKAWWICNKGHSYKAAIYNRVSSKTGCPYCAGKKTIVGKNDLKTLYPRLVEKEWDYELNKSLPENYTANSEKKVFWICQMGHSYLARISHRTMDDSKCPYCSGRLPVKGENDLGTVFPAIYDYWDWNKNKKNPDCYKLGSSQKIWLRCKKCGYGWRTRISSYVKSKSCPKCD